MSGAKKKQRILHVVQSLDTGGLENGVVNLANGIDRQQFSMDILCLRHIGRLRERLGPETNVFFNPRTTDSIQRSMQAVREVCRQGQYDIVHTHGWATLLPGFLGTKITRRARIVNGEHGTFFTTFARQRIAQRWLFRLVDANCAVSVSLAKEMHELFGIPPDAVQAIINGVDVSLFRPDPEVREVTRQALGIAADEVLIGTVGRLVGVKDYRTLITAFGEARETESTVRLLLVGDGPELADLRGLAEELDCIDRVLFAGNRDDVPALLNAMDVFCLTSLREGLSNTLLEAHACGVASIVTKTGGNEEVVADGVTGYTSAVGDSRRIGTLMRRLAGNRELRQTLGAAARRRACEHFSISRMVSEYEAFYANVLK